MPIKAMISGIPGRDKAINRTHNARIKLYPDGTGYLLVAGEKIWTEPGYEPVEDRPKEKTGTRPKNTTKPESLQRARQRAAAKLRDYALCNHMDYFVTLTVSDERYRMDAALMLRRLRKWLSNQVERRGLQYILVPEYHKNGGVHFHALFNSALDVTDSGTIIPPGGGKPRKPHGKIQREEWLQNGGHVVYNLPAWDFGFTTAIKLYGQYTNAIKYVCKYIGKTDEKIGGRWYYHSQNLIEPRTVLTDSDFYESQELDEARVYTTSGFARTFVYVPIKIGENNEASECD